MLCGLCLRQITVFTHAIKLYLIDQFCPMGMKRLGLMFWDDTKYTKRLSVSPASLKPRPFWPCKKGVQTRSRLTSSLVYIKSLSLLNRHHCATTVIDACSHKSEHLSDYATPTLARRGLKPCYDTFFQLAAHSWQQHIERVGLVGN